MNWVAETIMEMRGGVHEKCDYCGKPFDKRGAIPDEGQTWSCWPCWDRWESENARANGNS